MYRLFVRLVANIKGSAACVMHCIAGHRRAVEITAHAGLSIEYFRGEHYIASLMCILIVAILIISKD